MVIVEVNPGACGLKSTITVHPEDGKNAKITIESDCPAVEKLGQEIANVDASRECFSRIGDSPVYHAARNHCKHAACPVPAAIIKGIEAACGWAVPRDVNIKITKP